MALAVSLWIAGGGVASADELYIDVTNNTVFKNNSSDLPEGVTVSPNVGESATSAKTLSVTNGDWRGWNIYGGYSASNGSANGYTLILSKTTDSYGVSGGKARGTGTAMNNTITLSEVGYVSGDVTGGKAGNASSGDDATGNTVTVTNSEVYGTVYGGDSENCDTHSNTVTLSRSVIGNSVYGGKRTNNFNGNTLILFNGNKVESTVGNFDTIKLQNSYTDPTHTVTVNLAWDTEKPLLSAGSFEYINNLDISDAKTTLTAAPLGTMTILQDTYPS